MRFNRIGLTALATAAALTLGGCISIDVTSSEEEAWLEQTATDARAAADAAQAASDLQQVLGRVPKTAAEFVAGPSMPSVEVAGLYASQAADVDGYPFEGYPALNSIIVLAADVEEQALRASGPLNGMPILLKDNIETRDMPTTAGSLALVDNAPGRDAPLVARLREAGAVILGKTNLSEWANIRSSNSTSGWSAVGGLTRNPHALDRNTCGSSSGSGAAVAAGLAPAAIGTETDGSITCPAAINGIVGFKPTVGLVSRTHIVPISHSQDTAGPMTRTVEDAAIVLSAIAGSDPLDAATAEADARKVDYRAALEAGSLAGARIGVMRFAMGYSAKTDAVFEANLERMREAGAVIVEIAEGPDMEAVGGAELEVLLYELKHDLNAYLASTDPRQVQTRTLADVIAFNERTPRELALFGQELFIMAQARGGLDTPAYVEARATSLRLAGPEGIDRLMREHDVVALIAPTTGPAWTTDVINGDHYAGAASTLPAVAGYPHLTVPMGFVDGLPVGMSFIAGKWEDAKVLSLGHAFEQLTQAMRPPAFVRTVDGNETLAPLLAPLRP
ncbi:MAG: amidase [Brevundimonas sp.]|uniref:amidase n=1 Tax=Brevundimonas sp. TaxID=1871086 RepID=UPI002AB9B8CE|nr:amidase [Brevundimonas sp.]MDZ4109244.1 amidase [Brevundimonas sp.]